MSTSRVHFWEAESQSHLASLSEFWGQDDRYIYTQIVKWGVRYGEATRLCHKSWFLKPRLVILLYLPPRRMNNLFLGRQDALEHFWIALLPEIPSQPFSHWRTPAQLQCFNFLDSLDAPTALKWLFQHLWAIFPQWNEDGDCTLKEDGDCI